MKRNLLTLVLLTLTAGSPALASLTNWQVNWDLTNLRDGYFADEPNTRYYLGAQLTNGGNGAGIVRMRVFDFNGGHLEGADFREGTVNGSIAGDDIELRDTNFYNAYIFGFQPGAKLSFSIDIYDFSISSLPFPDSFSFGLYKGVPNMELPNLVDLINIYPVGSLEPLGHTDFARYDFGTKSWETYDSFASVINDSKFIPAPVIKPVEDETSTPEPGTLFGIGGGLLLLVLRRRKK